MHVLRFNIAGALGVILFVAVGFAALREGDELWASWLLYLALVLLPVAVLLAARRTGDRRAFWIGFALFGSGYLGLSLIPSTEARLITTKALSHLHQSTFFGARVCGIRVIPDLDRMRAYNLSLDDFLKVMGESLEESRMLGTPEQERYRRQSRTFERVRGSYVLSFVHRRYNEPEQWGNIVLKATAEGEILRLKDVAKVERGSPFYAPRWAFAPPGTGSVVDFIHIGHTLIALLAAWLGGALFRRLGSGSRRPEVLKDGE